MKREKGEMSDLKKLSKKQNTKDIQPIEEEKIHNITKKNQPKTLIDQAYQILDNFSKQIIASNSSSVGEDIYDQLISLVKGQKGRLALQQIHNLEYANRLYYIKDVIESRNLKSKHWSTLVNLISQELERVQQMYMSYLQNCDYLMALKQKYDPQNSQR